MSSIDLKEHIICLRPEADFIEFDAVAPARFSVEYLKPDDFSLSTFALRVGVFHVLDLLAGCR